ncbi:MAG: DUF2721 domain-containing protein [Granulosicoccaceae bacterium]|jgi:hypothetical protein
MEVASLTQLVPVLQTAISPVILISGIGLVLLTMTNRLGRIVDRSRVMTAELPNMAGEQRVRIERELEILWKRARLMRLAIGGLTLSALSAAVLVMVLFFSVWLQLPVGWLIGALFISSMGSLCVALLVFIREIRFSLEAIALEVDAIEHTT